MKHKWSIRTYVDLFAGAGKCVVDKTHEEIDGSALVALRCEPPFTHYFFNDMSGKAIDALQRRARGWEGPSIEFFHEDCHAAANTIIQRLPPNALHFCFIDPTNWQISFSSNQKLADGRRMDLAITFHTGQIKRVPSDTAKLLDDFSPPDSNWRAKYRVMRAAGRREGSRVLLDAYEEGLKGLGYRDIQDWVVERNSKGVPLYHLLFASKHPRGRDFWNKVSQKLPSGQFRMGVGGA